MKVTLNITYNGQAGNYPVELEDRVEDDTIRRIAEEAVRAGEVPGIRASNVPAGAFQNFVVDRFHAGRGGRRDTRYVVRPKVPFGADANTNALARAPANADANANANANANAGPANLTGGRR